jgi:protease secretion system membrane fusion protein
VDSFGGFGGFILCSFSLDVCRFQAQLLSQPSASSSHQTGGIIDSILVKEGEHVKVGQILVRMNDIQIKAQAEITRIQLYTARAVEARLLAERDGKNEIAFPAELLSLQSDTRVANSIIIQNQLFTFTRVS